jgi:SpoVK/Ycf46/Vps4 family AAA+-type ATPase
LVVRQSSDLVSKYVGETEQNIARLFNTIDAERSILFIDEVDSFLRSRRDAQHSWEITAVNELLQHMENFPGIFIAATNLMTGIDPAALRRFDFKLAFQPMALQQRVAMFAREALGDKSSPNSAVNSLQSDQ